MAALATPAAPKASFAIIVRRVIMFGATTRTTPIPLLPSRAIPNQRRERGARLEFLSGDVHSDKLHPFGPAARTFNRLRDWDRTDCFIAAQRI